MGSPILPTTIQCPVGSSIITVLMESQQEKALFTDHLSSPEEYRPNLGLSVGLDGYLCGFLGVGFSEVLQKVSEGMSDNELVEWCFDSGLRPNPVQKRIWNAFSERFGWRDRAAPLVEQVKTEDGMADRNDI